MPLLTVEEAAKTLRVGEETIRRWIRSGKLAAKKAGKAWLIPQSEIAKILA